MKYIALLSIIVLLSGCTLNNSVPKTQFSFNPTTKTLDIKSPKDVVMTNVVVKLQDNNVEMTIGSYSSANNIEVIKAAVEAQKNQIDAIQKGVTDVVTAVAGGVK